MTKWKVEWTDGKIRRYRWDVGNNTNDMTIEKALDLAQKWRCETLLDGTKDYIGDFISVRIVRDE